MNISLADRLSAIAESRKKWENTLWQAEIVDLPVAQKLNNADLMRQALEKMASCKEALAIIDKIESLQKESSNAPS